VNNAAVRLDGLIVDLGDVVFQLRAIVPGTHPRFVWHIAAPQESEPADRVPRGSSPATGGKVDVRMDLQADKKVVLTGKWEDEVGNFVPVPADAEVSYTVDDDSIIALTDNGDGTAVAAATGSLGTALVHGEASHGGRTATGDLSITVVPGDAERFSIEAGEPEEVTPDVPPTP
jgi:hypothetical protein